MNNFMLKCRYSGHDTQNKMIQGICINKNCKLTRAFCSLCLRQLYHYEHLQDMLDILDFQGWVDLSLQQFQQCQPLMREIEIKFVTLSKKIYKWQTKNVLQQKLLYQANCLFKKIKQNSNSFLTINIDSVEQMTTSQINVYVTQIIQIQEFYNSRTNKFKIIDQNLSNIIKKVQKINSFLKKQHSKILVQEILPKKTEKINEKEIQESNQQQVDIPKPTDPQYIGIQKPKILILREQKLILKYPRGLDSRKIKEQKQCSLDVQTNMFKVFPKKANPDHVHVILQGPKNTAFDGGIYQLLWEYPEDYFKNPPKITLLTKIFHINIKDEKISVDILGDQWSFALSMDKTLLSIISLLDDPNPDDPLNFEGAELYQRDRKAYYQKVQEYKLKYASPTVEQLIYDIVGDLPEKDPGYIFLKGNLTEWIDYWKNFKW